MANIRGLLQTKLLPAASIPDPKGWKQSVSLFSRKFLSNVTTETETEAIAAKTANSDADVGKTGGSSSRWQSQPQPHQQQQRKLSTNSSTHFTDHFKHLPKLPVPDLNATLASYLNYVRVLVTDPDELQTIERLVEDFRTTIGPKLQLYLLNRQQLTLNWAYEYWLHDMYLNNLAPLPINSNPGMVFPPLKFTTVMDMAKFTTKIIDQILDFKVLVDNFKIETELTGGRTKGDRLCMAQAYRLLTSYRYPGEKRDRLRTWNEHGIVTDNWPTSLIAIYRNQMYAVRLSGERNRRLTRAELCAQLLYVLNDAPCLPKIDPVGVLTSAKRSDWWRARCELRSRHSINRTNLERIEQSILIVCFDDVMFDDDGGEGGGGGGGGSPNKRTDTDLLHQMIHGCGSARNSANRWFDKTIQLIVGKDGSFGLCYEHSPSEAPVVIRLLEDAYRTATAPSAASDIQFELDASVDNGLPRALVPQRLDWILEPDDYKNIQVYGKGFIKDSQISPDVYVQLALQLAYYRLHGKLVSSYESASTRRFCLGRVDNIRSATLEANTWVKSMSSFTSSAAASSSSSSSQKENIRELFKRAVEKQTRVMTETINGHGIDIHLLGLCEAAKETLPVANYPLPKLFTHYSYRIANEFQLSTSQVTTSLDNSFMGYGAVVPDGYGASYNIKTNELIFCLSAFRSSKVTNLVKFAQSLENALVDLKLLVSQTV